MTEFDTHISPSRPYLVRAIFEWIEDNGLTPYLLVNATMDNVQVPAEFVQDGRIVLSIASHATNNMYMNNDYINFEARFGGVSRTIWVPLQAVIGIYAKENSEKMAMFFNPNEYDNHVPKQQDAKTEVPKTISSPKPKRENKAGLKVLK